MQVRRTPLHFALMLVALLLPGPAFAQETCEGRLFALSYRFDEFKRVLPGGTEWKTSEHSIGLCVDPAVKQEVIAALQSGRELSGKALEDVRVAVREGRALVRFVTARAADLGAGAIETSWAVAASTADLSGEALSLLASGAGWAWRAVARPALAASVSASTRVPGGC